MTWASWTTQGVYAGRGGVRIEESAVLTGQLDVHTTWTEADGMAHVAVQPSGGTEWFTLTGSPVPCPSAEASRTLHDAVLVAVRAGQAATLPHPDAATGSG
ncbi:hypothetical protein [Streptomyces sp. NPDC008265]|uniref:hypothetical protein n=1 Tax=Streptomyces sp. NPDC008265 TaxID=3364824 RepID=UPI0036E1D6F0